MYMYYVGESLMGLYSPFFNMRVSIYDNFRLKLFVGVFVILQQRSHSARIVKLERDLNH